MKFPFKINIVNVLKTVFLIDALKKLGGKPVVQQISEGAEIVEASLGIDVVDSEKLSLLTARVASALTEVRLAEDALRAFVDDLKVRYGR